MKYKVLFTLKNNEKVFMNVVCCSRDWRFEGYRFPLFAIVHSRRGYNNHEL